METMGRNKKIRLDIHQFNHKLYKYIKSSVITLEESSEFFFERMRTDKECECDKIMRILLTSCLNYNTVFTNMDKFPFLNQD